MVSRRRIAAVLALVYFTNSVFIAPGATPSVSNVLLALLTVALWFSPWLGFRSGWFWWPSYLVSTLISMVLVYPVVGAWVLQFRQPETPLLLWPKKLLYLFACATLLGLFCLWQTPALFVHRVAPWWRAWRERVRKLRAESRRRSRA